MPEAEDLLSCPICFETFQDPVLLGACGHSYCARCVRGLPTPLRCPTCRQGFAPNSVLPNFALRALLRERENGGAIAEAARPGSTSPAALAPREQSSGSSLERRVSREFSSARVGVESLQSMGVPAGLAALLREEDACIALRIFLLDNSGSTAYPDGCIMEERPDGSVCRRPCTRWDEVKHLASAQAAWNLKLRTPCEFVLLNPAARGQQLEEGVDYVRVDAAAGGEEEQLASLSRMLQGTSPRGTTPLTERLQKIHARVAPEALELARRGQKVVVVIVTDGLPTAGYSASSAESHQREMVQQLRRMGHELPIHLVVRLCTNDDEVVSYYNSVDEEIELQLEVLDDMEGEAREIYKAGNRWLVYSPLMHRIREGGTFMKILDLVDERMLTPMEICLLCQLLLRQSADDAPLPTDAHEFCRCLRSLLPNLPQVYDPMRRRMLPPVLIDEVEWAVLPSRLKRMCGDVHGSCLSQ